MLYVHYCQGIQQLKDQGHSARFIFLAPPDISELEQRLRRRGSMPEEKIKGRLEIATVELEHAKLEGFHDKTFVNDDLEATFIDFEKYIFDQDEPVSGPVTESAPMDALCNQVKMEDSDAPTAEVPPTLSETPPMATDSQGNVAADEDQLPSKAENVADDDSAK